tara:strand:- start:359 stop:574 length:216 start_codon:yes stop_codon:yes gene_type:complete
MNAHQSARRGDTNEDGITFKQWYAAADRAVYRRSGLGVDDLPDGNSWDAWNESVDPSDYAVMLLEEEGFPF